MKLLNWLLSGVFLFSLACGKENKSLSKAPQTEVELSNEEVKTISLSLLKFIESKDIQLKKTILDNIDKYFELRCEKKCELIRRKP